MTDYFALYNVHIEAHISQNCQLNFQRFIRLVLLLYLSVTKRKTLILTIKCMTSNLSHVITKLSVTYTFIPHT